LEKEIEMLKKFKIQDVIFLLAALLSLIYSEVSWFKGEKDTAIFVGLWVPSILGFGIYLKYLTANKND
jgi:hypothetical protein